MLQHKVGSMTTNKAYFANIFDMQLVQAIAQRVIRIRRDVFQRVEAEEPISLILDDGGLVKKEEGIHRNKPNYTRLGTEINTGCSCAEPKAY